MTTKLIENINLNKHIITKAKQNMRDLAKPLLQFNVTHFGYQQIYRDNSIAYLTTHPEFTEFSIKMKYYKLGLHSSIDAYAEGYIPFNMIKMQDAFYQASYRYDIDHGMLIIKKNDAHCEFFYFASSPNYHYMPTFYLNNINLLENFTAYFKDKAKQLIMQATEQRIIYNRYTPSCDQALIDALSALSAKYTHRLPQAFSAANQHRALSFITNLTNREQDCLRYLAQGYTAKQIAKVMNISYRTVEKHVASIKAKVGVSRTGALLAKYHQML